jgi:hypothetical protein
MRISSIGKKTIFRSIILHNFFQISTISNSPNPSNLFKKNILKIPHEHRVLLEDTCVIEDCFAEGFAEFFFEL